MSFHATAWAKSVTHDPAGKKITKSEKLLLMILADYVNPETGVAWPSVSRLSVECLMSPRNVRYVTQSLEEKGLLRIERKRKEDGSNASNRYRFPALAPEAALTVSAPPTAVTAKDLADALVGDGGVLEGYIDDYPDSPANAYRDALDAADLLAAENAGVSKDVRGYLRNAVLAHAALSVAELDGKAIGRLNKEAKALGASGHGWLITALLHTASANVEGDAVSYAIATARRMKAEVTS